MDAVNSHPGMFSTFSKLPIEIRLRVWAFAAPPRPRVIQIYYNREEETWHAWKDGCGGLSSIALTCREAFSEALKPYVAIFDTYFHLEHDTLFISDPLFTLRQPRSDFMRSPYVEQIRKIALTNEQHEGLGEMHAEYPGLCPSTTQVLRELKCLRRFILVLSEDAAMEEDMEEDEDGMNTSDSEEGFDLETDDEADDSFDSSEDSDSELQGREEDLLDNIEVLRILERQESEAMEAMPKGYFRQVGDIHFQHATANADHWDNWEHYGEELPFLFQEEKDESPEWLIPNICIVVVRYGLNPADEDVEIHIRGDFDDGVVTKEAPKYLVWRRNRPDQ